MSDESFDVGEVPGSSSSIRYERELTDEQRAIIASMVQGGPDPEPEPEAEPEPEEPNPEQRERRNSWFIEEESKLPVIIIGPDNIEIRPEDIIVAPDGGWGWVVVMAAFLSNLVVDGTINSSGILLLSIVKSEEKMSKPRITNADVSWIVGLMLGFNLLSGPFVSMVANKIGFRLTAMIGSALSSLALIVAYVLSQSGTPNVPALYVCYGVVTGIGFGFIYVPAIVTVGFYFQRKRALATGISVCGSGVGTFVYPPLTNFLISQLEWPRTILVQGLILACSIFLGAVYRPLKPWAVKEAINIRNDRKLSSLLDLARTTSSAHILRQEQRASLAPDSAAGVTSSGSDDQVAEVGSNETVTDYVPPQRPFESDSPSGDFTHLGSKSDEAFLASMAPRPERSDSGPSMLAKLPTFGQVGSKPKTVRPAQRLSTDSGLRERIASMTMTVNEMLLSDTDSGSDFGRHMSVASTGNRKVLRLTNTAYSDDANAEVPKTILLLIDEENTDFNQSRVFRVKNDIGSLNNPFHQSGIFYGGNFSNVPEFEEAEEGIAWEAVPVAEDVAAELVPGAPKRKRKCKIECSILRRMLDVSLLKSPTFLLLAGSGAAMTMGYFVPFIYLSELVTRIEITPGRKDYKFTMDEASLLIAIIGITNTIGRIVIGMIADRLGKHIVVLSNMALLIAGLLTASVPFLKIYALLVIYSGIFGICLACVISLRSIILVQFLGLNKLTNAFGLTLLFQGICALAGSPFAGFLFETTRSYDVTFYFAGAVMAFAGLICFPINYVHAREVKKSQEAALLNKRNSTAV